VKYWITALAVLAWLSESLALADDFKTINRKEYKNTTVSHVEADGIVLRTESGISKVYFVELPKEVQKRFHYDPAKVVAAQREAEEVALQSKQDESRLSSTAVEDDEALPKKIFIAVIVFVVCLLIAIGAFIKKSYL